MTRIIAVLGFALSLSACALPETTKMEPLGSATTTASAQSPEPPAQAQPPASDPDAPKTKPSESSAR